MSIDEAIIQAARGSNHVSMVDAVPYIIKPPVRDWSTHLESIALAIVRIFEGAALIVRVFVRSVGPELIVIEQRGLKSVCSEKKSLISALNSLFKTLGNG